MARPIFEDLPSTNTPINANNLNILGDGVANIGTSVDSSYNTNLIQSDNMIDLTNFRDGSYSGSTGQYVSYGSRICTINKTEVEPDTKYTVSLNNTTGKQAQIAIDGYQIDGTYIGRIGGVNGVADGTTITTRNNCKYINITIITINDSMTSAEIRTAIANETLKPQMNLGETLLPYDLFTQKSIYVNNTKFTETIGIGTSVNSANRVNVLHSKNLFDGILEQGGYGTSGEKISNNDNYRNANKIPVKPNTTYTTSINGVAQQYVMCYYNSDETFIEAGDNRTGTFKTPNNCYFISFRCYIADYTSDYANLKVMVNEGSEALPYEPYISPSIVVDNDEAFYSNDYSTGETRIGNWINGKPLYRKVYKMTNQSNSYTILKPNNLSEIAILNIMQRDSDGAYISQYYNGTSDYLRVFYTNNYIQIRTTKNANTFTHWITIEYTKTTD